MDCLTNLIKSTFFVFLLEIQELENIDWYKNAEPDYWIKVTSMEKLNIGDHFTYPGHDGKKHGIIVAKQGKRITLMKYKNNEVVDREDVKMERDGKFYVINPPKDVKIDPKVAVYEGQTYSPLSVVHRAFARFKEENYRSIRNYEWGFPRWCKTGCGGFFYDDSPKLRVCEQHITYPADLQKGDHIMFDHKANSHHAIVLSVTGIAIKVIHFTGTFTSSGSTSGWDAEIKEETIEYKSSMKLYRVVYRREASSPVDLTIARANAMIKAHKKYSLTTRNCEDLATWCKTGVWQSHELKPL